jgi:hypothetical protein
MAKVDYSILGVQTGKAKVKFFNPYEGFEDYELSVDIPRKEDGTVNLQLLNSTLDGIATSKEESMRLEWLASQEQEDAVELFGEVNETEEENNGE